MSNDTLVLILLVIAFFIIPEIKGWIKAWRDKDEDH